MSDDRAQTGKGVSRRDFVTGLGAAGFGGLVVGGAAGYFLAPDDDSSSSSGGGASGEDLKIGSVGPVTGPYSGDGEEMVRGQELAIAEINANGGVAGRQLVLVTADVSDLAPENYVQAAQRLVNQEKVAAVFSGYCSNNSTEFYGLRRRRRANVPPEHIAGERRLRHRQRHGQHLPGLPERDLVRQGIRSPDGGVDPLRRMGAVGQDGRGRHQQRPLQHLDRQGVPVGRRRTSGGTSRSTRRSRRRRRTGAPSCRRSGPTRRG